MRIAPRGLENQMTILTTSEPEQKLKSVVQVNQIDIFHSMLGVLNK